MAKKDTIVHRHPAEITTGVAGALAYLIVYLLGVEDLTVYFSLGIVLAFLPTAITWVVELVRSS